MTECTNSHRFKIKQVCQDCGLIVWLDGLCTIKEHQIDKKTS